MGCGLLVQIEDGAVKKVKGDPEHPSSLGDVCAKAVHLPPALRTPDRLLYPQVRTRRDAERLIALALGLNASGSLTEDRFWEAEMSTLVAKLLENGNDAPIDGALDHLYQTNLGAYDTLIELVENESEAVVAMQGDRAWQGHDSLKNHPASK